MESIDYILNLFLEKLLGLIKKNAPRFSFTPKNLINAADLHIFGRNEKLKINFPNFSLISIQVQFCDYFILVDQLNLITMYAEIIKE